MVSSQGRRSHERPERKNSKQNTALRGRARENLEKSQRKKKKKEQPNDKEQKKKKEQKKNCNILGGKKKKEKKQEQTSNEEQKKKRKHLRDCKLLIQRKEFKFILNGESMSFNDKGLSRRLKLEITLKKNLNPR